MSEQSENIIRRRVIFHGRVQGVGFRYTTCSIAARFPVGGWVKNLPDGTVEVVAEGTRSCVAEFLDEVAERFRPNISDRDESELSAIGSPPESGFHVRY